MTRDNALSEHHYAFFTIETEIYLVYSCKYFVQVIQIFFKIFSMRGKVIHENFHSVMNKINKDAENRPLKCGRGIA